MIKGTAKLINALSEDRREYLFSLKDEFSLSESTFLELLKDELDLALWKEGSIEKFIDREKLGKMDKGQRKDEVLEMVRNGISLLRKGPVDYSSFTPEYPSRKKTIEIAEHEVVFGKCPCPVDGEKTRCCKLTTLDVIMQCAFSCSYCAVRSFYDDEKIIIPKDLEAKLLAMSFDENKYWHIGTGQASDSLMLGDDYSTLSALSAFARKHPDVVIEHKSKSERKDIFDRVWPRNMLFTWSLNASVIIEKEEHLTATLDERISAARKARDKGALIGFHIHPMVYFKGWEDGYREVVGKITSAFAPDEITVISAGTLVFTKEVIKTMRIEGKMTRTSQMELTKSAGKYTYPLEVRKRMYDTLFAYFPEEYKEKAFTYLCLEDPSLWPSALHKEYSSDSEFELDMKRHYMSKIT